MKRVVCLLLCTVLLLGLLPAAALADGELQMYFEICNENGVVSDTTRWTGVGSMYGDSIFFRAYTAETGGEAITGDQLCLYENNEPDTNGMLTWIPSGNNGYYKWDTHAAKAADPVFLATIDGQKYKGRAQVHEAEVGWFSSRDKSISTALTYGFATDANVFYDGTEAVTVYLTADFSFTTNITLSEIKKTNDNIQLELEPRGSFSENNLGSRLKVTCPAGLSGELTLTVPLTQKFVLDTDAETVNYTVTFSKSGKKPGGDMPSQPGEPVAIKVKITDKEGHVNEETCWFGVGVYTNNKYDTLSGFSMGNPGDAPNFAMLAVGLWRKNERSDGTWDLAMLSKEEAEQVMQQATFHLNFYPQSGQKTTPKGLTPGEIKETYSYRDLIEAVDAAAALGMPKAACYPLEAQHEGKWLVEAVCDMNEKTYTAYGDLERRVTEQTTIKDRTTVTAINEALETAFKEIKTSTRDQFICVVMSGKQDYQGQITVPAKPRSFSGGEINVEFRGTGETTLVGGICSDDVPVSVSGVSFIGAGKDHDGNYYKDWPDGSANAGKENTALSGNAAANAGGCTFTGYYYAMKLSVGMRLCGEYNAYVRNHIAWYLGTGNNNGGNPAANNCVFERNDYAIWIEKFNLRPSFYAPSRCRFLNNTQDIQNNSEKSWFIPGNYFVHATAENPNRLATAISPATSVSCYPMCNREQNADGSYSETFYYDYEQLSRDQFNKAYRLSNELTNTYQTPEEHLAGKTFEVVDENTDKALATFDFTAQQPARAPRRSAARAAGQTGKAFDATVSVERTETQIRFTMNDPCRQVMVSLPCAFAAGTVTLDGSSISDAVFDGQSVTFPASAGGVYTITAEAPTYIFAAGYDKDGRLVGIQALESLNSTVNLGDVAVIKRFQLNGRYCPIAPPRCFSPSGE